MFNSQRRTSINDSVDEFGKSRRTSLKGGDAPTRTELEPPCRPTTVAMLYRHRDPETGVVKHYGSGPVSVVGWTYPKEARIRAGESEFRFSDGSGSIIVKLDIPSTDEAWLLPRIKQLIMGETGKVASPSKQKGDETNEKENNESESETVVYRYLHLVAAVTQNLDTHGKLIVRAVHLREAQPAEAAYHHSISCILVSLQLATPTTGTESATDLLEGVVLFDCFNDVTDADQLLILKYITKYRKVDDGGVDVDALRNKLVESMSKSKFESAMESLSDNCLILYSDDECYVDLVVE